MTFFPRFHYPTIPSSYAVSPADILRMIGELENSASGRSGGTQPSSGSGNVRAFSPNFDVYETEHEHVLEGELPGLSDKKNVSIEFTDDKTILVHGHIERSRTAYRDSEGNVTTKTIEQGEEQKKVEGGSETKDKGKEKEEKDKEGGLKYWVSERSVGEFWRSFSFPTSVDIDRVKASLDNGILKVVVPKLEKEAGGRRIEVS